jgi:hypothetical protein
VDFACYGNDGFAGIEVKRSSRLRNTDLDGQKIKSQDKLPHWFAVDVWIKLA